MAHRQQFIDNFENHGYLDISETANPHFLKIKVPGDGNCSFYSLALGLINLIVQGKLELSDSIYKLLALQFHSSHQERVIKNRIEYYEKGVNNASTRVRIKNVAPLLTKIQEAVTEDRLNSFEQFKYYLLGNRSYNSIFAMAIFMGPALRALSVKMGQDSAHQNASLEKIKLSTTDGIDATFDQINLLANLLDVHLIAYDPKGVPVKATYDEIVTPVIEKIEQEEKTPLPNNTAPLQQNSIAFLFSAPGHFDFLLPKADYKKAPYYFAFEWNKKKPGQLGKLEAEATAEKKKFKGEKYKELRVHIRAFENAIQDLTDPGERKIGTELLSTLRRNSHLLFTEKPSSHAFTLCQTAIHKAHQQFKDTHHRSLNNVLANLALFLLGVGVLYLLAGTAHYFSTGRFTFFDKPALHQALPQLSQQLLKAGEEVGLAKEATLPSLETPSSWSNTKI